MITVTGTVEDALGNTLTAYVTFTSLSTPQQSSGGLVITANTVYTTLSNPNTGVFNVALSPGNYLVAFGATQDTTITSFTIAVPSGSGTVDIGTLITSPIANLPGAAPYTLFNGTWSSDITFNPVLDPTTVPVLTAVTAAGGGQSNTDQVYYTYAWQDANGNTTKAIQTLTANTPPTGSNNATAIALPAAPTGAVSTLIYRSNDTNVAHAYLLTTLAANVTSFTDLLSIAQFNAISNPAQNAPTINTTAGIFYGKVGGNPVFGMADAGNTAYKNLTLNGTVNTAPNQTNSGSSALLTVAMGDARYGIAASGTEAKGLVSISSGAQTGTVTGLGLAWTPSSGTVTVWIPNTSGQMIFAVIVGSPTSDGFVWYLSAPAPGSGYKLSWQLNQ